MFKPGQNCLTVTPCDRAAVIVDAADYFLVARQAMLKAERRIMLIGWDFDPRISLVRRSGVPDDETLGSFLLDLVDRKPQLRVNILKWDLGSLKILGRGLAMWWEARWAVHDRVQIALDHAHPAGCSHHQKILVIDDAFAVCGGIDMTGDRWDTTRHTDRSRGRVRPGGKPYKPWHDATMAVDGDAASCLAQLGRDRWRVATGKRLQPVALKADPWPEDLEPSLGAAKVAIARTVAKYGHRPEIREIEQLVLDIVGQAERSIYIENQYFTSAKVAGAIARRLQERPALEVVLVGPLQADGWLEQVAMDAARVELALAIGAAHDGNRFRIYCPFTTRGQPIYVHAKVMIVDDRILRVGSSNLNNRSLGLDSECDLTIDGGHEAALDALRTRLLAEHLGQDEAVIADSLAATGSMIATVEALRGRGRSLRPLKLTPPTGMRKAVASTEALDAENADAVFEPMAGKGLLGRFRAYSGRKSGTDK